MSLQALWTDWVEDLLLHCPDVMVVKEGEYADKDAAWWVQEGVKPEEVIAEGCDWKGRVYKKHGSLG